MKKTFRIKAFIDTNVLVDYLIAFREKHDVAVNLFTLVFTTQIEAAFTTQSILDAAYICRKYPGTETAAFRETVRQLLDYANTGAITLSTLSAALKDPDKDLEDSAQIAFAYEEACDVIITHDRKLLSRPVPRPIQVMTPEEFLMNCYA